MTPFCTPEEGKNISLADLPGAHASIKVIFYF